MRWLADLRSTIDLRDVRAAVGAGQRHAAGSPCGPQKPEKKSPANTHATSPDRNKAKNGSRVRLVPINRVQPEYPALAKKLGANGIVEMVATVGKDGHVIAVQVLRGHPLFKQA